MRSPTATTWSRTTRAALRPELLLRWPRDRFTDRDLVRSGTVVHSADRLVLVGRRRAEAGAPFAVPGGKPEAGETVEQCAVRELAEETGLVLAAGAVRTFACVLVPADEVAWVVAGVEGFLGVPAAEAGPRELEPEKFGSFRWIDPTCVREELFPATAALLERLRAP
jgi:8-oxo-dGTP diphosphatase